MTWKLKRKTWKVNLNERSDILILIEAKLSNNQNEIF